MVVRTIPVEDFDLVIFGATGDLAHRMIVPGLYRRYLAGQMDAFVAFMEKLTGLKWDADRYDRFKAIMEESNKAYSALVKLTELRKRKPCPLPGRTLVLNELVACMSGSPACTAMLETQLQMGEMLADMGMSASKCPEEKYRVCLMQNMLWSNTGIMD